MTDLIRKFQQLTLWIDSVDLLICSVSISILSFTGVGCYLLLKGVIG